MSSRLLLIATLALSASMPARAHCPIEGDPGWEVDQYSVAKEYARSRYVVRVRSFSETWLGEDGKPAWATPPFLAGGSSPLGLDPFLGAIYELDVVKVFKGSPPKRLRFFSSNTTARTPLPVGGEYLLFIQEYRDGVNEAGLSTFVDHCGNSTEMPFAGPALREVMKLVGRVGVEPTTY
jgi:hypothetical protein